MSFDWEAYKGGGNYITAAEKKVLAENGIPFEIQAVRQVYKFENENYELSVLVPDPETGEDEERTLSFAIGTGAESRDRTIAGMAKHFEDGGEPIKAKVEKVGRGYFLIAA